MKQCQVKRFRWLLPSSISQCVTLASTEAITVLVSLDGFAFCAPREDWTAQKSSKMCLGENEEEDHQGENKADMS